MNHSQALEPERLENSDGDRQQCEGDHSVPWRALKLTGLVMGALMLAITAVFLGLIFHKASPPTTNIDLAAAGRLQSDLQKVTSAGGPVLADEVEVNSILQPYLERAAVSSPTTESTGIRDIRIKLNDDRIHVYVLLEFHGKGVTVDFESKIYTENGYVRLVPTGGRVGALAIPKSVLASAARQMMESPESREQLRLPNNISDLRVQDGKIRVVYR